MTPVVTEPRPAPAHPKGSALALLAAGLAVALVLVTVMPAMDSPPHLSRLAIDNPHEWAASVEVAGSDRDSWVGLGTVERQTSHTFEQVLDRGDQWRFRFWYAGVNGGELVVSRSDLDRRGWKVSIPDAFADRMRAAGLAPSGG